MFLNENDNNLEVRQTVEGDEILMSEAVALGFTQGDEELLQERSIVKLDKKAKLSQLISRSTTMSAKEANDPLYKKLEKVNKERMKLKKQIEKKYASKGKQRAKQVLKGMGKTKSDMPKGKNER